MRNNQRTYRPDYQIEPVEMANREVAAPNEIIHNLRD
jgi:hypothetical protein